MNMPVAADGTVHFSTTLLALVRESLEIRMGPAHEMDKNDEELRETIKTLWPVQGPKMTFLLVPPNEELTSNRLTVGKIYAGLLIAENWKAYRASKVTLKRNRGNENALAKANSKSMLFSNLMGVMKVGESRSRESLNYLDKEDIEEKTTQLSEDLLDKGSSWSINRFHTETRGLLEQSTPEHGFSKGNIYSTDNRLEIRKKPSQSHPEQQNSFHPVVSHSNHFESDGLVLQSFPTVKAPNDSRLLARQESVAERENLNNLDSVQKETSTPFVAPVTSSRLTPHFTPIPSTAPGSGYPQHIQPPSLHPAYRGGAGARADNNVETINVTNIMSSPSINRLGSLFSSINKSVGSAISNLMASQHPDQARGTNASQKPIVQHGQVPAFGFESEHFGSQRHPPSAVPPLNSHAIDGSSLSGVGSKVYPTSLPPIMQEIEGPCVVTSHDVSITQSKAVLNRGQLQTVPPPSIRTIASGRETNGQMVDGWSGGSGTVSRPLQQMPPQRPAVETPARRPQSPPIPNVAITSGQTLTAPGRYSHKAASPRMQRGRGCSSVRMQTSSRSHSLNHPPFPPLPSSSSSSNSAPTHQQPGHPRGHSSYKITSLKTRYRSPSPLRTQQRTSPPEYYGSANLTDRSRSPSPKIIPTTAAGVRREGSTGHREACRPRKPNVLNFSKRRSHGGSMPQVLPSPTVPHIHKSPGNINFPRLNASPSHSVSTSPPKNDADSNAMQLATTADTGGAAMSDNKLLPKASSAQLLLEASPGLERSDGRGRSTQHLSHSDLPHAYGSLDGRSPLWLQGGYPSGRPKPPSAAGSLPRYFKQSQVLDVDKIFSMPSSSYSKREVIHHASDSDDEEDGEWC